MVECVLSQLKLRGSTFLAVEKATAFSTAKNVELLGLYQCLLVSYRPTMIDRYLLTTVSLCRLMRHQNEHMYKTIYNRISSVKYAC